MKNLNKWIKWSLSSVGIIILVGFCFWSLWQSGFFLLKTIHVNVQNEASYTNFFNPLKEEIQQELSIYTGKSILEVPIEQIQTQLLGKRWIQSLSIYRRWPNEIRIDLQAKELVFLMKTKKHEWVPVVDDGSLLSPVDGARIPDVPLVTQEFFEKDKDLRGKLISVIKEIPKQGIFSRESISNVGIDHKEGFWVSMIATQTKIKLGNENYNLKSERLSQVIEYLNHRELKARVIDANFNKKVLVRLRKDP